MANPSGIPQLATQVLMPDGTMNPLWYRYLRQIGTQSAGSVILVQDTLANRPVAAEYADGSVLFIATDTGLMYYVASAAWVQVMNFIGYDGTTVSIAKPVTVTGAVGITGAVSVTGTVSATGLIHSSTDVSASGVLAGDSLLIGNAASVGNGLTVLGGASITGNSTVTGSLNATTTITAGTGLTVSAGGAAITGASSVTGNLNVTAILSGNSITSSTTISGGSTVTAGTGFLVGAAAGESITLTLAKLTTLGSNGSATFTGGIETAHTDPT